MRRKTNLAETVAGCIIAFIGVMGLAVVSIVMRGLVLSQLWNWFIVPILHGPHINLGEALAISLVTSFFTAALEHHDYTEDKSAALVQLLLSPLMALAFGAMWHYVFGVGA